MLFRPIAIVIYKAYIIITARVKTFFHAQHKLLAIITHRLTIHFVVVVLTVSIVVFNMFQGNEVRADEFAEGSLIGELFRPNEEIITAATITATPVSYIDTSASVKATSTIDQNAIQENDAILVADGGAALLKPTVISGNDTVSNSQIATYTVQAGDTVSSIAADFDISTKTVEWVNNLEDGRVIKPGDTLYILPTDGVAYTVKSGDTVGSIAQEFEADEQSIIDYNDLITAKGLIAGTEIIVPGGEKPQPPAPVVQPSTTRLASFGQVFTGASTAAPNTEVSGTNLQWPTTTHRISQYFTYRHSGIDIDGEFGDSIYAAEAGTVISAGSYSGYGLQVVVSHGNGLTTRYAHLQKMFVSNGQTVVRGQTLGEEGSTGWSTGSHLHFEVMVNGQTVNPFNYY